MNYIIAVGVFQSLMAMAVFRGSKQKRPADYLLLWLVGCIFTHLSIKFFIFTSVEYVEVRRQLVTFIGLAYGPLLWMYTRKLQDPNYHPYQNWYLLLPTLLAAVWYMLIVLFIGITHEVPHPIIQAYYHTMYWGTISFGIFPLLVLLRSAKLPNFWSAERKLLRHLAILFVGMPVLSLAFSYLFPIWKVEPLRGEIIMRSVAYALLGVAVIRIASFRLSLHQLMNRPVTPEEVAMETEAPEETAPEMELPADAVEPAFTLVTVDRAAQKQLVRTGQQEMVLRQLDEKMRSEKLYKDADLTLEKLAANIGLSRNQLSEALNQAAGKSFYQYVNDFRVQEVVNSLDKCRNGSVIPNLLVLAYDAGFKSKSSFNLYFKKITGHTPTEYLKQEAFPLVPNDSVA
ncbi:helix-turn-helix domain-containing protein [Chitinophaga horti]|uniref:Helix-turn-helix domain-containing protein n=1 Tax=Chitinophaga horti TaxID=2920382 RepID=A0ABY6IX20_9BACT|nr:AraC family transcriptional regulator [Chitinophaga horti]UYQ91932.1 helix-turn-helix domain-containing protein [Chitinophaga horti]